MTLQEILKEFLVEEDKINSFLGKMKENKIFTASEENLDVRYKKLKDDFDAKDKEHAKSLTLIDELKKSGVDNEDMQNKISAYESNVAQLKAENEQLKLDNAIKVKLLSLNAKASDLDYLMFKIKQDDNKLSLDDNGEIKGLDLDAVKSSYPNNFEVESKKEVDVNNLPNINDKPKEITKEEFSKMGYQDRNKLYKEDLELYKKLSE